MKQFFKQRLALLLIFLLLAALPVTAFADNTWWGDPNDYSQYFSARLYTDGLLSGRGYLFISTYYMPLEGLCELAGIHTVSTCEDGVYTIEGEGFSLYYIGGSQYVRINDRYFLAIDGLVCVYGKVYVPVSLAEKVFNVHAQIEDYSIWVETDGIHLMDGGPNYYNDVYGEETYYYLSHIIEAEAFMDPFQGRVAIGNVVMNRVASDRYPNTVKDVVSDRRSGLQFAGTLEDAFQKEPSEDSLAAAAIALEGYNIVEDCMFFVSPDYCDISWFEENTDYYDSIGSHRFYYLGPNSYD